MSKVKTASESVSQIGDGATIMIGGFVQCGVPEHLIDALVAKGVKGLTVISNNVGLPGQGIGKLIRAKQVKKLIASHIGLNLEVEEQMLAGELEVQLFPQGSLAEKIRAGGAGLGGILTPTGIGTIVEEGKQILEVEGKRYILELPLRAEFGLIKAYKADTMGNLKYRLTARNFNPLMALACDYVIAEVEELVQLGELDPDEIVTPGILVDSIVVCSKGV